MSGYSNAGGYIASGGSNISPDDLFGPNAFNLPSLPPIVHDAIKIENFIIFLLEISNPELMYWKIISTLTSLSTEDKNFLQTIYNMHNYPRTN